MTVSSLDALGWRSNGVRFGHGIDGIRLLGKKLEDRMEEVSNSGCILCCCGLPLLRCSCALRAHQNPGEWLNWRF